MHPHSHANFCRPIPTARAILPGFLLRRIPSLHLLFLPAESAASTPDEIAERAAEVRATWSAADRRNRRVDAAGPWEPPIRDTGGLPDQLAMQCGNGSDPHLVSRIRSLSLPHNEAPFSP